MIQLKVHSKTVLEINEEAMSMILGIYPDEHLMERPLFADALASGELSISALRKECETLLIPWQLFLLKESKLKPTLERIEARRKAKFSTRLIANRSNDGSGISLRIADRVIGLQEFASSGINESNDFCGMLITHHRSKWSAIIASHFSLDPDRMSGRGKETVLKYLIKQTESKNIRVSRGVLSSSVKFFPVTRQIQKTYRQSSGFVVHDEKLPYIFLPDEMGNNETPGRQILTLLVLLVLVGTNNYDYYLTGDLELRMRRIAILKQAFGVATEILFPYGASDVYRGQEITYDICEELSKKYMLTPSAVMVTLRQRDVIASDKELSILLDSIPMSTGGGGPMNQPKIETAVNKLCGMSTTKDIVQALNNKSLTSINAQYLVFGRVDKLQFAKFAAAVGL